MNKFRIIDMQKLGRKNIYCVNEIGTVNNKFLNTQDLKILLEGKDLVSNAILKGDKIVEIPDTIEYCGYLIDYLKGNPTVFVDVVKVSQDKTKRYIKFYTAKGDDITGYIGRFLVRVDGIKLTESMTLTVSGMGMDMIYYVLNKVNQEAKACGAGEIINANRYEIKK